jgi:hypothetical protein
LQLLRLARVGADGFRSPGQVVGYHEILIRIVFRRSLLIFITNDQRVFVTLTNTLSCFRWHHFMKALVANNRELTLTDFLSPLSIDRHSAHLSAIDKTVIVVALEARQARLFDQLLNLGSKRSALELLLLPTIKFLVASNFLSPCVQRGTRRHNGRPWFASGVQLPSALFICLVCVLHRVFGDEPSLQQLIT